MSKDFKQEIKSEQVEISEKSNGFLCPMCGAHFFSEDFFVEHIKEHKSVSNCSIKQEIKSESDKPSVFMCPVCAEHVYSDTQLIEHVKQHHDHSSPEVPENLDNADNLTGVEPQKTMSKDFKQEIKSEQVEISEKSNGFLCPMCGAHFFSEDFFVEHIKEHKSVSNCSIKEEIKSESDKPSVFMCPVCAEHVYSDTQLIEHVKQHHDHSIPEVPENLDNADNLTGVEAQKTLVLSPSEMRVCHLSVKPFKCSECSYATSRTSDLTRHMGIHSGEKRFKCSECSYATNRTSDLTRHMGIHSGEKRFKCLECSMSKGFKQEIKSEQVEISEKSNGFLCPMCGAHFFSEDFFVEHIKEHKSVSNCSIKQEIKSESDKPSVFMCPVCAEHVYSDTQLIEHVKQHHDHSSQEVPENLDNADNLTGAEPQKTMSKDFKQEIKSEQVEISEKSNGFLCPMCGAHFFSEDFFVEHIKEHKSVSNCSIKQEIKPESDKPSVFMCPVCAEHVFSDTQLIEHVKQHHDHSSQEVPKNLDNADNLTGVEPQKTLVLSPSESLSVKPFKCSECSYATSRTSDLTRHMRIHSGDKPFKCSECSFAARETGTITRHMRIHSGEKPFKCSECSYAASQAGNLTRNTRIHSGEKPFKCSECSCAKDLLWLDAVRGQSSIPEVPENLDNADNLTGVEPQKTLVLSPSEKCSYATREAGNLTRHMRIHSGEKPFKCSECSFAARETGTLTRHMRIHSGEKPFKCSECSFAARQAGNLTRHMRIHSGEKPFKCSVCSFAAREQVLLLDI
ncbi:zinc finger protein 271-like [Bolinopsis microptera]|uniref:zinc finger protein 271-like n=1 Tax=Bolinopsis microptera TaxID=2820187 RepID=UPI00307B0E7C